MQRAVNASSSKSVGSKKTDHRLRARSDFERLKENGRKSSVRRWFVAVYSERSNGGLRYGFTITRKVGGAVLRNKLKRWGRECFRRLSEPENLPFDVNVIIRPMSDGFYDRITFQEFGEVFEKTIFPIQKSRSKPSTVVRGNVRADL